MAPSALSTHHQQLSEFPSGYIGNFLSPMEMGGSALPYQFQHVFHGRRAVVFTSAYPHGQLDGSGDGGM